MKMVFLLEALIYYLTYFCPFSQNHSPKTFQEVVLMLFYPILAAAVLEKLTNIGIVSKYQNAKITEV
jgi:hypothetical protein